MSDEMQLLVSGSEQYINIDDWMSNTRYIGFTKDSPQIQWFWDVIREVDNATMAAVLKFGTSCSRPPLLGFQHLQPHFAIQKSSAHNESLPTSSTCVNLLRLPEYESKHMLRDKLLYAVNSNAGFELS